MCMRRDLVRSFSIAANGCFSYFVFALNYPSLKELVDEKRISSSWTGIILGVYSVPSFFFWISSISSSIDLAAMHAPVRALLLPHFSLSFLDLSSTHPLCSSSSSLDSSLASFLALLLTSTDPSSTQSPPRSSQPINTIFSYFSMGVNLGKGLAGFMGSYVYFAFNRNIFYLNALFTAIMLASGAP